MATLDETLDLATRPIVEAGDPSLPIGIVGAGAIVRDAHLPAYRAAGWDVRAIYDVDAEAAEATAKAAGIPHVSPTLDDLLEHGEVEVIDVAVPAAAAKAVVTEALESGHHVLTQKPLADSLEAARDLAATAARSGRLLAVNHQMRWSPSVRAATEVLRAGHIGELVGFTLRVDRFTDFDRWPWLADVPYPELWYNTLHYLDASRVWLGEPARVYARLDRHPRSALGRPTRTLIVCEYSSGALGVIQAGHESLAAPDEWEAWFQIVGRDGELRGTLGELIGEPGSTADTIKVRVRGDAANRADRKLPGAWFPGAFAGPMGALMRSIGDGSEPPTSAADALRTLELVRAVELSHESGQPVELPIAGD